MLKGRSVVGRDTGVRLYMGFVRLLCSSGRDQFFGIDYGMYFDGYGRLLYAWVSRKPRPSRHTLHHANFLEDNP